MQKMRIILITNERMVLRTGFQNTHGIASSLASLKPVADMLESLICAWVGIEHLESRSVGPRDDRAAHWIPAETFRPLHKKAH